MNLLIQDLGQIEYGAAWQLQNDLAEKIAAGLHPETLLLLEHPHTYTFGRRGQAANLLWDEAECARRGISIHWVDRGGDVTYHGPGQLVGYPLLRLTPPEMNSAAPRADYVGYIRSLEKTLIVALASLGLVTGQLAGHSGVWIQPEIASRCPRCLPADRGKPAKIAAIGVKVDARGVTRHGFALNVAPQMEYFEGIIPCGLSGYPVISLADLLETPPAMEKVKAAVSLAFRQIFEKSV
ncbi:MAG: lipoyl(octanoyl) transferase LipB [Anaerolineales bacterium]